MLKKGNAAGPISNDLNRNTYKGAEDFYKQAAAAYLPYANQPDRKKIHCPVSSYPERGNRRYNVAGMILK